MLPLQSASAVQSRHVPVAVAQAGVVPVHCDLFVDEHTPHAPLGWQAGVLPPQSASAVQPRHVPEPVAHTGVAPEHFVLLVDEQTPHAPLGWHAGVLPPHSPSPPQLRQVWLPPSQIGVELLQSALATHRTHVPVDTLHTGVAPTHWVELPAEQAPQAPLDSQAGVLPPHSLSPEQLRQKSRAGSQTGVEPPHSLLARHPTHVLVDGLQTGVAPPQFASVTHWTQVAADTLQTGVVPVHKVVLVDEHWPQAPPEVQAGVLPPHSLSAAQARHACVPVSQVGAFPLQFVALRHPTHTRGDAVVRQWGVAPLQLASLAQLSTMIGVGGVPGPPPLPSET